MRISQVWQTGALGREHQDELLQGKVSVGGNSGEQGSAESSREAGEGAQQGLSVEVICSLEGHPL